jgi:hypothetical protein
MSDPVPHQREKYDLVWDPHQSEKPDLDPHHWYSKKTVRFNHFLVIFSYSLIKRYYR